MNSFLSSILSAVGRTSSDMTISLSAGTETLVFPVLPSELMVSVSTNHETLNITNYGDFLMMGKTGLKSLTLSGFFPAQSYPFAKFTEEPYTLVNRLEAMRTGSNVCTLTVSDTPISMPCVISEFSYGEKDGTSDVYYELHLTEYRYIKTSATGTAEENTGLKKRTESVLQKMQKTVTYYPGDSIGTVLGRSIGKSVTLNNEEYSKFDVYRSIVRSGGLKTGDIINLTKINLKRNGEDVPITKDDTN